MKSFRRSLLSFATVAVMLVGMAVAQTPPRPSPVPRPAVPAMPVPPPPDVDGQSWVLMDYATGQIIASKNPDARRAPASLTKVMTDYVVSAEIANGRVHPNDMVTISEHAWRGGGAGTDGSTSFLKLGSQVPLEDLLKGMIVQSGNDAAIALAEHTAGSEDAFANLMNAYAKQLGMSNTHYSNASGYPVDNHYSSARDIAILSRALIRDFPTDYAISAIKEYEWNGIKQQNRNELLWRDPAVDGIKTGHTAEAGYCLDASAKHGDERMIAVVMGASTNKARADSAMALLNYGFRFYETHKLYEAGKALATPRLWKGAANQLSIGVASDVLITVKTGEYDKLKATMDIPATLIAPFKKGQQIGTLRISLDGKPIQSAPLIALADAPQGGFFSRLWDTILLWFHHDKGGTTEQAPSGK
ncbi:MAG TPA: D-alanyl-D-alanine carboxypeptidase family protein [Rhodanobacter sp.]|nr:D-alanyl-D-alanine carboxypeptidase family protein [Rhodanobacter sp.]